MHLHPAMVDSPDSTTGGAAGVMAGSQQGGNWNVAAETHWTDGGFRWRARTGSTHFAPLQMLGLVRKRAA